MVKLWPEMFQFNEFTLVLVILDYRKHDRLIKALTKSCQEK